MERECATPVTKMQSACEILRTTERWGHIFGDLNCLGPYAEASDDTLLSRLYLVGHETLSAHF